MTLPLPRVVADVGPGGPLVTAMGGMNALTRQNLENKYYGPTQQADIASKTTYARYLPAQIIGQVLSNPLAWQTMPKEQLQSLVSQYANALTNPPSLESLGGGVGGSDHTGNSLLSMLFGKNQSANAVQQSPQVQSGTPIVGAGAGSAGTGANSGYVYDKQGNNVRSTQDEVHDMANTPIDSGGNALVNNPTVPNTTINRTASSYQPSGSYGGLNPLTMGQAQAKGLEATATTEATGQASTWTAMHNDANQQAVGAQNNINLLDKFNHSYDQLGMLERGPALGRGPAVTSAAQDTDVAANGLADSVARAQQAGHITGADRQTYLSMKPGRYMNPAAKEHQVSFIQGMNERLGEVPAFLVKAQEVGLNPQQARAVWLFYSKQRPFFNSKTNEINEKNLGTWEDYLTQNKLQQALSPKAAREGSRSGKSNTASDEGAQAYKAWPSNKEPTNADKLEGQAPPKGTIWMINPDGEQVAVHKANVGHAKKKYNFRELNG